MHMRPVRSGNVRAVGYDGSTNVLHVEFHSGGLYEYQSVDPWVFFALLMPQPWHEVGGTVRAHAFTCLSKARSRPR